MTNHDEATVNSDSIKQPVPAEEEQTAAVEGSPIQSGNTLDVETPNEGFSEIQNVGKSALDKDTEDGENQNKVVTESTIDEDTYDDQNKAQTESAAEDEFEDDRNKRKTAADFDENLEDDQSEVLTESTGHETVESDRPEVPTADQVEGTSMTRSDEAEETAAEAGEVERDDSGGDEMSEEQFLSPAASDADISEKSSPTTEEPAAVPEDVENRAGGNTTWSPKVPLLDTEPPAMESDYEEAPSCEMEEKPSTSETVLRNSRKLEDEDGRLDEVDNTSDQSTPVASSTVKPKPM